MPETIDRSWRGSSFNVFTLNFVPGQRTTPLQESLLVIGGDHVCQSSSLIRWTEGVEIGWPETRHARASCKIPWNTVTESEACFFVVWREAAESRGGAEASRGPDKNLLVAAV